MLPGGGRRLLAGAVTLGPPLCLACALSVAQDGSTPPQASVAPGAALPPQADSSLMENHFKVTEQRTRELAEEYQIEVEGATPYLRTQFDTFSRGIREDFRRLLRLREVDWSIPIRVSLKGEVTDVHSGRDLAPGVLLGPDNLFVVTLAVRLHDRFDEERYARAFIRALLTERILDPHAENPEAVGGRIVEPEWMIHGFQQLIDHRRAGRPSAFYAGFLESNELLGVEEIFTVEDPGELSEVDLAIYRASSSALVAALLDQPDGHLALRGLLGDLAAKPASNYASLLKQHFPGFRDMESGIEKWWALEVASLAQQQSFEFFSPGRTERALDQALTVAFEEWKPEDAGKKSGDRGGLFDRLKLKRIKGAIQGVGRKPMPAFQGAIADYEKFRDRPDLREHLQRNHEQLQIILAYGHPLYRPLVDRYLVVVERIAEGKTNGLDAELKELAGMRRAIGESLERTRDTLNHYEAATMPEKSDAFESYSELRKVLEEMPPPKRKDRISRYLDRLEEVIQ